MLPCPFGLPATPLWLLLVAPTGDQRPLRRELPPLWALPGTLCPPPATAPACSAAAWDTVEELSAAASHAKAATASKDPLEDVSCCLQELAPALRPCFPWSSQSLCQVARHPSHCFPAADPFYCVAVLCH